MKRRERGAGSRARASLPIVPSTGPSGSDPTPGAVLARFTWVENRQHASVRPQGRGEENLAISRPIWQADETRSAVPSDTTLFKYRLLWPDGRDAGRAAYAAGIGPGDVILSYRGQWLRVLATRAADREDTVYDGVLEVEPA
jgi:hypothetical protein